MTLIEEMALAMINAHRARIPLPALNELPIDTKMGNDSHEIERILKQATAALEVAERRLLSDGVRHIQEAVMPFEHGMGAANLHNAIGNGVKAAIQAAKAGE